MLSVLSDIYKKGLYVHPRTESFNDYLSYKEYNSKKEGKYQDYSPTYEDQLDKIEYDIETKIQKFFINLEQSKSMYDLTKTKVKTYPPMNKKMKSSKVFTFTKEL